MPVAQFFDNVAVVGDECIVDVVAYKMPSPVDTILQIHAHRIVGGGIRHP